jgi:hypothetical protein
LRASIHARHPARLTDHFAVHLGRLMHADEDLVLLHSIDDESGVRAGPERRVERFHRELLEPVEKRGLTFRAEPHGHIAAARGLDLAPQVVLIAHARVSSVSGVAVSAAMNAL